MLRLGARSAILGRHYATTAAGQPKSPLSGLSDAVRARAEGLSSWKGTSATGEKTKNYIGGEFLESTSSEWLDVIDPVGIFGSGARIVH
jgi:malonate-semialdehyde dehydrogenase (acetylating) / methylmalonate-semialdehyde dehydrogenase